MLFDYETDLDNTKIETTNVMAKGTVKVCTRNWYEGEHQKKLLLSQATRQRCLGKLISQEGVSFCVGFRCSTANECPCALES